MSPPWQPYREPFHATLLRTAAIALVLGALFSAGRGGLARWPMASLLMLWPALGGHFMEIGFLNYLRPRLPDSRMAQVTARLAAWFVGGIVLALAIYLTARSLPGYRLPHLRVWWLAGIAFIGIELVAHLMLQLRGRPSFYNGRG